MKYKKHLPLILVPVFLLLSITSILFTWDLVKAGFYYRSDREKSARSMVAALQHKSSAYNALAKFNETALNNLLVKNTIAHQNLSYLGDLDLAPKNIETLHTKFKDNFF
ncbi:MAG: hypothetical protein GY765_08765, partial [bacterium]|nr:hypothetical protein [bacterium]